MSKKGHKTIVDQEILDILNDYQLFIDSDKHVDMPFHVNEVRSNHITSLKGSSTLSALSPLGDTVLECEMKDKSEFFYSFNILSNRIHSKILFRMDEGGKAHRNWHLPLPVDQQIVITPHFHKYGTDGIMYAYRTDELKMISSPLNIHDGFVLFCEESHINQTQADIIIREEGGLPFQFEPEEDPLIDIQFP